MINMDNTLALQFMMFLMMGTGMFLARKKIITAEGRKCLTDITIDVIIPCNMVAAFISADMSKLSDMAAILIVSIVTQAVYYVLTRVWFRQVEYKKRCVMRYGVMVSNAGFLGNPLVAEMYGQDGLLLASVFLVPVRLVLWTVGLSIFAPIDRKHVVKTALTHPCIVSVIIGFFLMMVPLPLPLFLTKTINSFSGALMPFSMLVIGTIIGDVDLRTIVSRDTLYLSFLRLIVLPAIMFGAAVLFHLEPLVASVSVVLVGMPLGTTTAILAAKYDGDYIFAAKGVVLSTLLSMITIPIWSIIVSQVIR